MKNLKVLFWSKIIFVYGLILCISYLSSCNISDIKKESGSNTTYDQIIEYDQTNESILPFDNNIEISIQYATANLIRNYKPARIIDLSSDSSEEDSIIIMVSSKAEIYNFSVYELDWINGKFLAGDILYTEESISPEEKLFFKMSVNGIMNFSGLSYADLNGDKKTLFIHRSDINGDLFVSKY